MTRERHVGLLVPLATLTGTTASVVSRKSARLRPGVGPELLPPEPWLLCIGVAGDRALEAREERAQEVATQRVPGGAAPAPRGESSANF